MQTRVETYILVEYTHFANLFPAFTSGFDLNLLQT